MSTAFKLTVYVLLFHQLIATVIADGNASNFNIIRLLVAGGYRPERHYLVKYLVSIRLFRPFRYFGDSHICGGSIIKPNVILTAAHCFGDSTSPKMSPKALRVVGGSAKRLLQTPDTRIFAVKSTIRHHGFQSATNRNDIGIVILMENIIPNGFSLAIIPLPSGPPQADAKCTVIGWGRVYFNGPIPADVVYADVRIWPLSLCKKIISTIVPYSKGMMCASDVNDPEKDACAGDSGGPLICNGKLVGIVSYGVGCDASNFPGIYTDVWHFRKWIERNHAGKCSVELYVILMITSIMVHFLIDW